MIKSKRFSVFKKVFLSMAVMLFGLLFVFWQSFRVLDIRFDNGRVLGATDKVVIISKEKEEERAVEEELKVVSGDARPLIIKRYLEKYKSPLAPYADLIYDLSEAYGFEYYWIVAIAQQESNLCKKIPDNSYNCWGYGIHSQGTLKFENYEMALKSFAEYLDREYFKKGLDTAELMMTKYCPHSNGSWAFGINQFIEEMEFGDL